jgi:hypothetical protein
MRTATGLTLVAIGAILAFAVTGQPPFLNLHITGCVIILTGVAGMLIPRRGYGWLRRRVVVKRVPDGRIARVEDRRYPPYVMLNPGSPAGDGLSTTGGSTDGLAPAPAAFEAATVPHGAAAAVNNGNSPATPGTASSTMGYWANEADPDPAEETVEEFFED